MEPTHIDIKGARVHNLRNVSLRLPRNSLICFTGVSGSGKSSLAFDTLYAEGQRRYIESLSSYARQFLDQIEKPDCDAITGLSPAIAIQQKTAGQNPRSTVGTLTAVHDFLRVLYARVGVQHCTNCGRPITAQTREQIIAGVLSAFDGRRALLLAPVARGQKGEFRDLVADLLRAGYVRARVDGQIVELRDDLSLVKNKKHDVEVVIDRLAVNAEVRTRLAEAVENALRVGNGTLIVSEPVPDANVKTSKRQNVKIEEDFAKSAIRNPQSAIPDQLFSANYACTHCNLSYEPPSPQLFSFNAPAGMCPRCDGLGESFDFDVNLLVPDDSLSFLAPAVVALRHAPGRWRRHIYEGVARAVGFDLNTPWRDLSKEARDALLNGTGDRHITFEWRTRHSLWKHGDTFAGVLAELREKYRKAGTSVVRNWYEKFMRRGVCVDCGGERLNPQARAVRLAVVSGQPVGRVSRPDAATSKRNRKVGSADPAYEATSFGPSLPELCALPVDRALTLLDHLALSPVQQQVAAEVLKEIRARLQFLINVGLHYLSLDRTAPTLSGGEAQRIRLAGQIGAGLAGVLYVLDEPSIGLHPRDNRALLDSLLRLRDLGNTVLVVEHDEDTMRTADHLVDFGPGPGVRGGEIVAAGTFDELLADKDSITAQYLRGDRKIEVPAKRRPVPSPPPEARSASKDHNDPDKSPKRKRVS